MISIPVLLLSLIQVPNVLLIIADDLGQDVSGSNWSVVPPGMPNLQALADEGVAFAQARVEPVCSTTRFGLYFGRYHRRANVWRPGIDHLIGFGDVSTNAHDPDGDRVALELFSLPETVAPSHVSALFGKWHLGLAPGSELIAAGPRAHGFDRWLAGNPSFTAGGDGAGYRQWVRFDDCTETLETVYATDAQRDAFMDWWDLTCGPKFGVLAVSDVHEPVMTLANAPPGYAAPANARTGFMNHRSYLDAVLGEVLATVSLTDTIVVFVGDNGIFNAGRPPGTPSGFWKGSTYEGGVRVPLVIAGPGIDVGVVSSRLVHAALDVPATLIELIGACSLGGFEDSVSFADELGTWTGDTARTWTFHERYETAASGPAFPEGYDDLALVEEETPFGAGTARWKYRTWDADGYGPGAFQEALYQLSVDPFEQAPYAVTTPGLGSVYARFVGYMASLPERAQ